MSRLLIHIATGPENPTRAALGLLVAPSTSRWDTKWTCSSRETASRSCGRRRSKAGQGIGTGSLREHVDALVAGGARLYASGMSSKTRGLTVETMGGLPVTMAPPTRLVELAFEADRVISY